jgi:hypothetical protein
MDEYASINVKELKNILRNIENQLEIEEAKLNYTTDDLLIDSIIFEMESLYKRHTYYFRLLREIGKSVGERLAV